MCFANTLGLNIATDHLIKIIKERYNIENISEQKAKNILTTNVLNFRGKSIDCSSIIKTVIENYLQEIKFEIINKAKNELDNCDEIILGGGGAYLLEKQDEIIKEFLGGYIVPKQPEFSNVRGYYKSLTEKYNMENNNG